MIDAFEPRVLGCCRSPGTTVIQMKMEDTNEMIRKAVKRASLEQKIIAQRRAFDLAVKTGPWVQKSEPQESGSSGSDL